MKLHELLAVESSVKGQAQKVRGELSATFEKKRHLFEGVKKTFTPLSESAGLPAVEEDRPIQSTVVKELRWISEFLAKSIDSGYRINEANTLARADVVLEDGTTFLTQLPATALLELEKRLAEVQEFIMTIPTLDPAKGFILDGEASSDGDVFRAREVTKTRTKKIKQVLTLAPATDKHPAQVQLVDADEPVGTIREQEWSGMLTPARKADMIARCESLARSVKKARSRANEAEVSKANGIGEKILNYVFAA